VVPEQHGKHTRNAEDQRKGEKIPLLAQKIYVGIAKELHGLSSPLSIYDLAPNLAHNDFFFNPTHQSANSARYSQPGTRY
jgi:hypothetical protein